MTDGRDFVSFVRANTVLLLRTAYLLTGSSTAAEELVQDTLVRLYPKWDRVSAADVPIAYVRRSLANGFVNERRRPVNRELVLDVLPEQYDAYDAPAQLADRDELWGLLRTLPDRQRAALVMRYFEDLPDDEIGAALGCRGGHGAQPDQPRTRGAARTERHAVAVPVAIALAAGEEARMNDHTDIEAALRASLAAHAKAAPAAGTLPERIVAEVDHLSPAQPPRRPRQWRTWTLPLVAAGAVAAVAVALVGVSQFHHDADHKQPAVPITLGAGADADGEGHSAAI